MKENRSQKQNETQMGNADELEAPGRRSKESKDGMRLTGGEDELVDDAADDDEADNDEADDDEADDD